VNKHKNLANKWLTQSNAGAWTYFTMGILVVLDLVFEVILLIYSLNKKMLKIVSFEFKVSNKKPLLDHMSL
jgi:hypothetical protein